MLTTYGNSKSKLNQIKTTIRYHSTPTKMATINRQVTICVIKDMEKFKPSNTAGMKVRWCSPFKSFIALQKMLEIVIIYDPAIPLVGIYPKEMKTYIHSKT